MRSVVYGVLLKVAVMVVVPVMLWAVARPVEEMVATVGVPEDQVTLLLMLAVEVSLKVPMTVYC